MALSQWMPWQCRAEDVAACCPSEEKLTAAVVQRLEHGEDVFPLDPALHPANPLEQLQVPPEFAAVRESLRDHGERHENLQGVIQEFTRSLLRGVRLNIMLQDGRPLLTSASLDSDLTHLVLQASGMQYPVPLGCIEDLCAPASVYAAEGPAITLPVPDDWCLTVVVRGGNFLTLLFEDAFLREYFEFCLKFVILAVSKPSSLNRPLLVPPERLLVSSDTPTVREELHAIADVDPRRRSQYMSAKGGTLERV